MEILGIGIPELLFIVLLILILFGPKEMVKTGRTLGRWLNQMVNSPTYKLLTRTGSELKNLPRNLMREANLDEYQQDIRTIGEDVAKKTSAIFDEKDIFGQAITPDKAKETNQGTESTGEDGPQNSPKIRPPESPQGEG
jgi:Sec-independent protein translocase protein TatA